MSERNDACQQIATAIIENNLANPFGGDVEQSGDRRAYYTAFSVPAILDGTVKLYSPKFILVQCQGRLAPGGSYEAVFTSVENAIEAILCICVVGKRSHADLDKIPVKERAAS